jgi:CheY-like chemotaxis protein
MDMRMPVLDGYKATRQIRELATRNSQPTTRTPIIALTASVFEEDKSRILSAGCDSIARKPIREAELFETISKHLGVQYVYEEEKQVTSSGQQVADKEALTPEILASLPPELLSVLEQAITQLDMKKIAQAIEAIRSYNTAVANAMAALTKNFKYQVIWDLIQKARKIIAE